MNYKICLVSLALESPHLSLGGPDDLVHVDLDAFVRVGVVTLVVVTDQVEVVVGLLAIVVGNLLVQHLVHLKHGSRHLQACPGSVNDPTLAIAREHRNVCGLNLIEQFFLNKDYVSHEGSGLRIQAPFQQLLHN